MIQTFMYVFVLMAARQLAGRRPLCIAADVSLFFFIFLLPNLRGLWANLTKLCHMFDGDPGL